jgi:hypothetical protein
MCTSCVDQVIKFSSLAIAYAVGDIEDQLFKGIEILSVEA